MNEGNANAPTGLESTGGVDAGSVLATGSGWVGVLDPEPGSNSCPKPCLEICIDIGAAICCHSCRGVVEW